MRVANEARELADSLGLTDHHVFFNDGWVDYEDRQNYLLDADVGVSTHFVHVETEFSFRTRMLDYLWAGLPMVATDGDGFADLIRAEGLGRVIPPVDVPALAGALAEVIYDPAARAAAAAAVESVRGGFEWSSVLAPLVEFCAQGQPAADPPSTRSRIVKRPVLARYAAVRIGRRLVGLWHEGGIALIVERARERIVRAD